MSIPIEQHQASQIFPQVLLDDWYCQIRTDLEGLYEQYLLEEALGFDWDRSKYDAVTDVGVRVTAGLTALVAQYLEWCADDHIADMLGSGRYPTDV